MNAATIFKTLTTVTLSITLLMTGGCNNMETKKKKQEKHGYRKYLCPKERPCLYIPTDRKEKVDLLVKAAMAAPTAVNKQPWAFVVVDDRTVLDKLAAELPYAKMTAQAPLAIVVCGDLSKALNGEKDRYWMLDCSAASENLLLAAESMGLGAVWTAVYPENDRIAKVRSVLSLPDHIIPFNLIPVGYPQHREESKDKFKTENIHYNKW